MEDLRLHIVDMEDPVVEDPVLDPDHVHAQDLVPEDAVVPVPANDRTAAADPGQTAKVPEESLDPAANLHVAEQTVDPDHVPDLNKDDS